MLKDIYVVLQKENKLELKPYVEKIQGIPGYENDPNCLYPIVVYQIFRGDSKQSKNALELLKIAYVPSKGYSPLYGTDTRTPDQLDKVVSSMIEESERASSQFDYLGKEPKQ